MSRMWAQVPMQAGSGLGSPVRRADVWIASDCVRSCARTCATRSAWVAPTVLTVISVLTIPVLAQQPNRPASDAHVMATHLRGARGAAETICRHDTAEASTSHNQQYRAIAASARHRTGEDTGPCC